MCRDRVAGWEGQVRLDMECIAGEVFVYRPMFGDAGQHLSGIFLVEHQQGFAHIAHDAASEGFRYCCWVKGHHASEIRRNAQHIGRGTVYFRVAPGHTKHQNYHGQPSELLKHLPLPNRLRRLEMYWTKFF